MVLVTAKATVVVLRAIDGGGRALASPWTVPAFLYQDVLAVAAFVVVDALATWATRSKRLVDRAMWCAYAVIAPYVAFNVPFTREAATPLTFGIARALGGALSDSAPSYFTITNVVSFALVIAVAIAGPRIIRRPIGSRAVKVWICICPVLFAFGRAGVRRVECQGLHRNALVAMVETTVAHWLGPRQRGDIGGQSELASEGPALDLTQFAGAARGRHVVWVVLESTGARYLKPYGAARDVTPNLTRLAEQAIVFRNVYSAYPESIKGLYAMLCAAYPAPFTEAPRYAQERLPCVSIGEAFKRAGYRTALLHSGRFFYLGMKDVIRDRGFERLADADDIGGKFASSFGTDDRATVERTLAFIDERDERPFFALYMPIAGHHPYQAPGDAPRPFPEKDDPDRYHNDLHVGDQALGMLIDGLRSRGLYHKTLWVIVGDHGEAFLQHPGNVAHSLFVFEENVHVPLIVSIPGVTLRTLRAPQIGSMVDLGPTVLRLAGIAPPETMQGRSLLEPVPGIARFFVDHAYLQLGLRHGSFKLIDEPDTDRAKLFELSSDPLEQIDVADRHPDRVARYRAHLRQWIADVNRSAGR
jgi:phosphoglycerol transferase MdoB-like AlkP superfamily enzyme